MNKNNKNTIFRSDNSNSRLEKAVFQDLRQVNRINNLIHKLVTILQSNQDLISTNYHQLELELNYLGKELTKYKATA